MATRIVTELKGKAPQMMAMPGESLAEAVAPGENVEVIEPVVAATAPAASGQSEALSALQNLGYGPGEAAAAVAEAAGANEGAETSVLIREALKRLAPKG